MIISHLHRHSAGVMSGTSGACGPYTRNSRRESTGRAGEESCGRWDDVVSGLQAIDVEVSRESLA